jgi:hypothetical protein
MLGVSENGSTTSCLFKSSIPDKYTFMSTFSNPGHALVEKTLLLMLYNEHGKKKVCP